MKIGFIIIILLVVGVVIGLAGSQLGLFGNSGGDYRQAGGSGTGVKFIDSWQDGKLLTLELDQESPDDDFIEFQSEQLIGGYSGRSQLQDAPEIASVFESFVEETRRGLLRGAEQVNDEALLPIEFEAFVGQVFDFAPFKSATLQTLMYVPPGFRVEAIRAATTRDGKLITIQEYLDFIDMDIEYVEGMILERYKEYGFEEPREHLEVIAWHPSPGPEGDAKRLIVYVSDPYGNYGPDNSPTYVDIEIQ